MAQCEIYPSEELPPAVKCQILSYVRVEWSWIFEGANRFWDYTKKDTHPVNVVIVERDVLISHTEVNWRNLAHEGETFKVYGVSAVFTYPAFRREGFGRQVMEATTAYIQASDADVAMLFCAPELVPFYEACGWSLMANNQLSYGPPAEPTLDEGATWLMLFVSDKGRQARPLFEQRPVYIGPYMW